MGAKGGEGAAEGWDCLVMAKPLGPRCNLRCDYCYYVGKTEEDFGERVGESGPGRRGRLPGRLSDELLERYVVQRLEASPGPLTHFEWHGGEPTLLGLDWFKKLVRLQKRHCPPGRRVTNGLQTNGLLITEAWAAFLREEGFSVGLSLDGPAPCHDAYRRTAEGGPSHERVERALRLLLGAGVFTNVLCVVHRANVGRPEEVYRYFRDLGARRLQFLPLVTPASAGRAHPLAAGREELGDFLCRVFDLWIAEEVGRVLVQSFDEALRPHCGLPHSLCIHRESCGDVAVLERDGGFYACDHFVDPAHRLGSIGGPEARSLSELGADPRLRDFGEAKRGSLPAYCRSCEVLSSCNGGCPKDRISPAPDGSGLVSWFCPSWKRFFAHARPGLEALARHLKEGRAQRDFKQTVSISFLD